MEERIANLRPRTFLCALRVTLKPGTYGSPVTPPF